MKKTAAEAAAKAEGLEAAFYELRHVLELAAHGEGPGARWSVEEHAAARWRLRQLRLALVGGGGHDATACYADEDAPNDNHDPDHDNNDGCDYQGGRGGRGGRGAAGVAMTTMQGVEADNHMMAYNQMSLMDLQGQLHHYHNVVAPQHTSMAQRVASEPHLRQLHDSINEKLKLLGYKDFLAVPPHVLIEDHQKHAMMMMGGHWPTAHTQAGYYNDGNPAATNTSAEVAERVAHFRETLGDSEHIINSELMNRRHKFVIDQHTDKPADIARAQLDIAALEQLQRLHRKPVIDLKTGVPLPNITDTGAWPLPSARVRVSTRDGPPGPGPNKPSMFSRLRSLSLSGRPAPASQQWHFHQGPDQRTDDAAAVHDEHAAAPHGLFSGLHHIHFPFGHGHLYSHDDKKYATATATATATAADTDNTPAALEARVQALGQEVRGPEDLERRLAAAQRELHELRQQHAQDGRVHDHHTDHIAALRLDIAALKRLRPKYYDQEAGPELLNDLEAELGADAGHAAATTGSDMFPKHLFETHRAEASSGGHQTPAAPKHWSHHSLWMARHDGGVHNGHHFPWSTGDTTAKMARAEQLYQAEVASNEGKSAFP